MTWVYLGRYDRWPNGLSRYSSAKARGSRGGKRVTYDYYVDDNGSLRIEKVTGLKKLLPKGPVYKRKKFICLTCGRQSIQLISNKSDILPCEYCDE